MEEEEDDDDDDDNSPDPESAVVGVYNVIDTRGTTNLELLAGGTFRTLSIGCDYEGTSRGLWALDGDEQPCDDPFSHAPYG